MEAFGTGAVAGFGIAIPVGAIAVLILQTGIRQGFWSAFLAGAGATSADLIYAGLAVLGGAALSGLVGSFDGQLRVLRRSSDLRARLTQDTLDAPRAPSCRYCALPGVVR